MTVSILESQILTATRAFLLSIFPTGMEVVRGQDNRVAEPRGADFAVMTPIMSERLGTNVTTYQDGGLVTPPTAETRTDMAPTKITVQVDIHGPNSADNVQAVSILFRSDVATTAFAASGYDVTPLYASEPRQAPFLNGEKQVEQRWTIDLAMQINPSIATAQDFAGTLTAGLIYVPGAFPATS